MLRMALYLVILLAVATVVKGFWTGKMTGNTTLYEVADAMKEYKAQVVEEVSGAK